MDVPSIFIRIYEQGDSNLVNQSDEFFQPDEGTQAKYDEGYRMLHLCTGALEGLCSITIREDVRNQSVDATTAMDPFDRNLVRAAYAMADEVEQAWTRLLKAAADLRLYADKDALEDLISEAEDIDLTAYTEESARAFTEALVSAKEVLADETLSEDDQSIVDEAAEALEAARGQLVAKADAEDPSGTTADPGQSSGEDGQNTADGGISILCRCLFHSAVRSQEIYALRIRSVRQIRKTSRPGWIWSGRLSADIHILPSRDICRVCGKASPNSALSCGKTQDRRQGS